MPVTTHQYSTDEITIIWKPEICIHATLCWKGLREVFNPAVRPWVKPNGATSEKIMEQIRKCPSGALSYLTHNSSEKTFQNKE